MALSIPQEGWVVLCLRRPPRDSTKGQLLHPHTLRSPSGGSPEPEGEGANYSAWCSNSASGALLTVTPPPPSTGPLTLSLCLAISLHEESERSSSFPGVLRTPSEPCFVSTACTTLGLCHRMQAGSPVHSPSTALCLRKGLSRQSPRSPSWLPWGGVFSHVPPTLVSHCTSDTKTGLHVWTVCGHTHTRVCTGWWGGLSVEWALFVGKRVHT